MLYSYRGVLGSGQVVVVFCVFCVHQLIHIHVELVVVKLGELILACWVLLVSIVQSCFVWYCEGRGGPSHKHAGKLQLCRPVVGCAFLGGSALPISTDDVIPCTRGLTTCGDVCSLARGVWQAVHVG